MGRPLSSGDKNGLINYQKWEQMMDFDDFINSKDYKFENAVEGIL